MMRRTLSVMPLVILALAVTTAACPFAGQTGATGVPHFHRRLMQGGGGGGGGRPGGGGNRPGGGRPNFRPGDGANFGMGPDAGDGPSLCKLSDVFKDPPIRPDGPSTQTATDKNLKKTVYDFLQKAMADASVPLGSLLRAAFHDAGTYDRPTNKGGANGSLRNELDAIPNIGIPLAMQYINAWRSDINALLPSGISISYADLFQLAGAMAVETAGGPKELYQLIPVGRVDIDGADATTTNLAGPDESYTNITCKFVGNGYTEREMMALVGGAHTVGFVNASIPFINLPNNPGAPAGTPIALSREPRRFNIDYWIAVKDNKGVLASDNIMADKNRGLVRDYINSPRSFFKDFVDVYVKMGKMGASWKSYGP